MNYQNILVETRDHVGLIILNRPDVLNALSDDLMDELGDAVDTFEADDSIGALVVTGDILIRSCHSLSVTLVNK